MIHFIKNRSDTHFQFRLSAYTWLIKLFNVRSCLLHMGWSARPIDWYISRRIRNHWLRLVSCWTMVDVYWSIYLDLWPLWTCLFTLVTPAISQPAHNPALFGWQLIFKQPDLFRCVDIMVLLLAYTDPSWYPHRTLPKNLTNVHPSWSYMSMILYSIIIV